MFFFVFSFRRFAVSHLMISILPVVCFFPSFLKMYFKRPRFGVLIKTFDNVFFLFFFLITTSHSLWDIYLSHLSLLGNLEHDSDAILFSSFFPSFQLKGFSTLYLERFLEICAIHKLWNIFHEKEENDSRITIRTRQFVVLIDSCIWQLTTESRGRFQMQGSIRQKYFWNIPAQLRDVILRSLRCKDKKTRSYYIELIEEFRVFRQFSRFFDKNNTLQVN